MSGLITSVAGWNPLGPHVNRLTDEVRDRLRRSKPLVMKVLETGFDARFTEEFFGWGGRYLAVRHTYPNEDMTAAKVDDVLRMVEPVRQVAGDGLLVHVPVNEAYQAGTDLSRYNDWTVAMVRRFRYEGVRPLVGNFSVGNPDLPPRSDDWEKFFEALEAARLANGGLALHEYWVPGVQLDGWLALRYRKVRDLLPPQCLVPFFIGECGIDHGVLDGHLAGWKAFGLSPMQYANQLAAYQSELVKDPYVIGATVFCDGNFGDWDSFDVAGEDDVHKLFSIRFQEPPPAPKEEVPVVKVNGVDVSIMWYDGGTLPESRRSLDGIEAAIRRAKAVANPKMCEASDWQARYDGGYGITPGSDEDCLAINERFGTVDYWVVPRGFDVRQEARVHAERARRHCTRKVLVVDYERYPGFFGYTLDGDRLGSVPDMDASTTEYFRYLREGSRGNTDPSDDFDGLGDDFTLVVSVDARQVGREFELSCITDGCRVNAWAPQVYWTDFKMAWEKAFDRYVRGVPWFDVDLNRQRSVAWPGLVWPMVPGDSRTVDLHDCLTWCRDNGYLRLFVFQLGGLYDADLDLIATFHGESVPDPVPAEPPPPASAPRAVMEEAAYGPLWAGIQGLRSKGTDDDRRIADQISLLMDESKTKHE